MRSRLRQAARMAAAVLLAALWGCAGQSGPSLGSDIAEKPDNSGLVVVAGHFETDAPFGLSTRGNGPVGRAIRVGRLRLGIVAVTPDPADPEHEIDLYRLTRLDAGNAPYCPGNGMAFPMAGRWTATGAHLPIDGTFSIVCAGSPEARCVHLGYRPWRRAADGASLWSYNEACVRALRADYCGSGVSHSGIASAPALYDRVGIQHLQGADGMSFEAGWAADGAVCVNHVRPPSAMTLKDLRTECANLPRAHLGNSCDERDPALIYTKSPTATPAS